jgi:hypothetical protein
MNIRYLPVRSSRRPSRPVLTGLGYLNDNPDLVVHPNEAIRYSDSVDELGIFLLNPRSNDSWIFSFHDACWKLLLSRLWEIGIMSSGQLVADLFNILYCTPCNRHFVLTPGHDYGGATQFQFPYADVIHVLDNNNKYSYLIADPMEPFPLQHPAQSFSTEGQNHSTTSRISTNLNQSGASDAFTRLPHEMVMLILNHMSSQDL